MADIKVKQEGKKLVIECDLTSKGEPSASGKSMVIASTRGNMKLDGGLFLGLNLYKKVGAPE